MISAFTPNLEAIKKQIHSSRLNNPKPSMEATTWLEAKLSDVGYTPINMSVYSTICNYGALIHERKAFKGLLLKGECGIGKTLGVEILASLFGYPVLTPASFIARYKELKGDLVEFEKFVVSGDVCFEDPKDIVIDDFGVMNKTRNYGEVLDLMNLVLSIRHEQFLKSRRLTIVTTNLSDREILETYGERVVDRMNEMFQVVRVNGRSLR